MIRQKKYWVEEWKEKFNGFISFCDLLFELFSTFSTFPSNDPSWFSYSLKAHFMVLGIEKLNARLKRLRFYPWFSWEFRNICEISSCQLATCAKIIVDIHTKQCSLHNLVCQWKSIVDFDNWFRSQHRFFDYQLVNHSPLPFVAALFIHSHSFCNVWLHQWVLLS